MNAGRRAADVVDAPPAAVIGCPSPEDATCRPRARAILHGMNGRERIIAALDGEAPDRVPLALAFYRVDGQALAPPGEWR